ncbi:MAG: tRNA 2-thiouridine(34) synthase MnmA [Myxococcales bacterium]|jgi:tRNA-specific 2-thiouridylase|nr:tRNA 2-thiouridine(34) synthase MnmA [Myxococcales bacterium]
MTDDAPKPTVLVALSGGVDSSVAAHLLQRQGYPLISATLQLNPCEDRGIARSCCGVDAVLSARRVASLLGIEHVLIDCRGEFQERVLRPAWEAYARGLTPSPCILCNERIKLGLLADKALRLGATHIATGHYARIRRDESGRPSLCRGLDVGKDQAYFLFSLRPAQLDRLLLPLGEFSKPEVRALAIELGLPTAERRESQDACLATSADGFAESLRLRFDAEPLRGPILDADGRVLGQHEGLHRFTIGQRRALGVSVGHRAFVRALRASDGAVLLTGDECALWSRQMRVRCVHLDHPSEGALRCDVQIRSRHKAAPALVERLEADSALVQVTFDEAQRAITPGQAAVFFEGERVVGGGWIEPFEV